MIETEMMKPQEPRESTNTNTWIAGYVMVY